MPGFYATHIFPRLMDWTMGTRGVCKEREVALEPLYGSVLEIGFGTGLNLPHYPKAVTSLTAVEPEQLLPRKVERRRATVRIPVELIRISAEHLPFEEGRFDCVLSTWTLCSIPDVVSALKEVRRVLKPSGMLAFLEHGRSQNPRVAKWQDRLNPLQQRIACGCNINRRIDDLIGQTGFKITRLDRFQMEGIPKVLGHMYRGTAQPYGT